jgi:agmatine deiminase
MALRMPAEWSPHAATWIAWPWSEADFLGEVSAAESAYVEIVRALAEHEAVHVLVRDDAHAAHVRERLGSLPARLHAVPTREIWLRDTGPTFVHDDGHVCAIDWTFNAWGGKYPASAADDAVAGRVAALAGARALRPGLVVEGGALEVDGEGTLLAVESSLLGPSRNPGLVREDLELRFGELLGVSRVIWLAAELPGDDTDGHVDNVARFVVPGRVACVRGLADCGAHLRSARDARGRSLEVVDLPQPPRLEWRGEPVPASYANFYVANGVVLAPVFGVATDAEALGTLAKLFPGRAIAPIPALALVRDKGGVHCLTQQEPI